MDETIGAPARIPPRSTRIVRRCGWWGLEQSSDRWPPRLSRLARWMPMVVQMSHRRDTVKAITHLSTPCPSCEHRNVSYETPLLQQLASEAGYSASSLSAMLGVDRATVYRLWRQPGWLREAHVGTLAQLAACIPGIASAIEVDALNPRLHRLAMHFDRHDLEFDQDHTRELMMSGVVAPQFLLTAIHAAFAILCNDQPRAVRNLRPLWGRKQSEALELVFGTHPSGQRVRLDQRLLQQRSELMIDALMDASQVRFAQAVAINELAHHAAKAGSDITIQAATPGSSARARNMCFAARGATMGKLRCDADLDIAENYHRIVAHDSIARLIEEWAFPTWAGDVNNGEDFDLPKYLRLECTAEEIIREIAAYNDGYVYYLANTYIPLALERSDPHFAGRTDDLAAALLARVEIAQEVPLRTCLIKLASKLDQGDRS